MSLEIRRLRGLPLFLALWTAGFLLLSPVTGKAQESSGTADETSQEDTGADAAESAGDEADTAETGTIPENIFISGQNVSGMTADEANQVVADYLSGYGDVEFTLQAGEKSVTADGEDIGLTAKNADVVTRALNYGKEGNLVSRYKANKDMENGVKKDFAISLTADINTAKTYLDENSDELNIKAVNNGLKRENGSFTYVEGSSGVTVLTDQSAVLIADYISAQWSGENATIDLITEVTEPKGTREELAQVQDVLGSFETDFSSSLLRPEEECADRGGETQRHCAVSRRYPVGLRGGFALRRGEWLCPGSLLRERHNGGQLRRRYLSGFHDAVQCSHAGGAGDCDPVGPLHDRDLRGTLHGRGDRGNLQGSPVQEQPGDADLY